MFLVILMSLVKNVLLDRDFEGFIVGGEYADIKNYSHSAFLAIECKTHSGKKTALACGSSIVNQAILLTAAHCFESCASSTVITVFAGSVHKKMGLSRIGEKYVVHEKYHTKRMSNDVALVKLNKNLDLGHTVQRVVLMKDPPYQEQAAIAGWGLIDDVKKERTSLLKHLVKVPVQSREQCRKVMRGIPKGTFCAGQIKGKDYIALGDSGSALVVRKFIQIGLVSFKYPAISNSLGVYTDVGYFYHWISTHAEKLFCE